MPTPTTICVPTIIDEFIQAGSSNGDDTTISTLRKYKDALRWDQRESRTISSDYASEILQQTIRQLNARLLAAHVLQALLHIARGEPDKAQEQIELARALLATACKEGERHKGDEAIALVDHQLSQLHKQTKQPPANSQKQESTLIPETGLPRY